MDVVLFDGVAEGLFVRSITVPVGVFGRLVLGVESVCACLLGEVLGEGACELFFFFDTSLPKIPIGTVMPLTNKLFMKRSKPTTSNLFSTYTACPIATKLAWC